MKLVVGRSIVHHVMGGLVGGPDDGEATGRECKMPALTTEDWIVPSDRRVDTTANCPPWLPIAPGRWCVHTLQPSHVVSENAGLASPSRQGSDTSVPLL